MAILTVGAKNTSMQFGIFMAISAIRPDAYIFFLTVTIVAGKFSVPGLQCKIGFMIEPGDHPVLTIMAFEATDPVLLNMSSQFIMVVY